MSPDSAFARRQWFIDKLREQIRAFPQVETVVEIGSGNGVFLNYLSQKLPKIKSFVGLDLNRETISKAQAQFEVKGLVEFHCEDFSEYISRHKPRNFAVVVCDTLSYFSIGDLEKFFESLRDPSLEKVILATYEYVDMNIDIEFDSKPKGNIGLSHNHPYLAKKAGLKVSDFYVKNLDPNAPAQNCISMIALNS